MNNGYSARNISLREADRLYPLAQLALARLTLDRWRGFVAAIAGRKRGGIVAVECGQGYARGMFTYSVVDSLHCERTLECSDLVVLDQFGIRAILATVLVAARDMARRHECRTIHFNLCDAPPELTELLGRAGFRAERQGWCLAADGAP